MFLSIIFIMSVVTQRHAFIVLRQTDKVSFEQCFTPILVYIDEHGVLAGTLAVGPHLSQSPLRIVRHMLGSNHTVLECIFRLLMSNNLNLFCSDSVFA